jgi:hypothetical protein
MSQHSNVLLKSSNLTSKDVSLYIFDFDKHQYTERDLVCYLFFIFNKRRLLESTETMALPSNNIQLYFAIIKDKQRIVFTLSTSFDLNLRTTQFRLTCGELDIAVEGNADTPTNQLEFIKLFSKELFAKLAPQD